VPPIVEPGASEKIGTNWAGNVTYTGTRLYRPAALDEVQRLVRDSESVKALGGGHSFSTIANTRGAMVTLERFNTVSNVNRAAGRVEVGAGVKYAQLCPQLQRQGIAVANLASLPHICVVGACSTATHGSGTGNLATQVAVLEFVNGRGEVVTLSEDRNGDEFRGAVVGLGAIGLVTKATLRVVPAFDVRQWVWENMLAPAVHRRLRRNHERRQQRLGLHHLARQPSVRGVGQAPGRCRRLGPGASVVRGVAGSARPPPDRYDGSAALHPADGGGRSGVQVKALRSRKGVRAAIGAGTSGSGIRRGGGP